MSSPSTPQKPKRSQKPQDSQDSQKRKALKIEDESSLPQNFKEKLLPISIKERPEESPPKSGRSTNEKKSPCQPSPKKKKK